MTSDQKSSNGVTPEPQDNGERTTPGLPVNSSRRITGTSLSSSLKEWPNSSNCDSATSIFLPLCQPRRLTDENGELDLPGLWIEKEKIYDIHEMGWDIGLKPEVETWLLENVGAEDEEWMYEDLAMTTVIFYFKNPSHAVLFKLTWG